jgi:type VI secretion system Hcp family effector
MAIFLKIDGVKGNVSIPQFKDWIQINELEFGGIHTPSTIKVGQAMDRNTSYPTFGKISFTKHMDASSNAFFEAAHSGEVFKTLEFNYVSTGNKPQVYGKVILNDVMVNSFADKHSDDLNRPLELIRVTYNKIERSVMPADEKNSLQAPMRSGYDIEQAKAS